MRRISRLIALWCAISLSYPIPLLWAGTAAGPPVAPTTTEICFPVGDGERMLKDLESLPPCREAVAAAEDALNATEERAKTLENRVVEQDRELKDARKLVEDTRKAGEDAAKVASGPWYQQVLNAGKWIALGIIVGFVGGMSK